MGKGPPSFHENFRISDRPESAYCTDLFGGTSRRIPPIAPVGVRSPLSLPGTHSRISWTCSLLGRGPLGGIDKASWDSIWPISSGGSEYELLTQLANATLIGPTSGGVQANRRC